MAQLQSALPLFVPSLSHSVSFRLTHFTAYYKALAHVLVHEVRMHNVQYVHESSFPRTLSRARRGPRTSVGTWRGFGY